MRSRPATIAVFAILALTGCAAGLEEDTTPDSQPAPAAVDRTEAAQAYIAASVAQKPAVAEVEVPNGFRLRQSRADNVALAFPPRWQALTSQDARYPGVMPMFGQLNRGLAATIGALSMPDGPVKLVGFDPRTLDGLATTASVMVVSVNPAASYADWRGKVVRQTRRLPSTHGRVRARNVAHPLGAALRLEYLRRYGNGRPIATLQYFVNRGETGYVVTYMARPKVMRRLAGQFAASARTLREADPA